MSPLQNGVQARDQSQGFLKVPCIIQQIFTGCLLSAGTVLSPRKHGAGSMAGKVGLRQTTARLVIDYVTWRLRGCQEAVTETGTGFY